MIRLKDMYTTNLRQALKRISEELQKLPSGGTGSGDTTEIEKTIGDINNLSVVGVRDLVSAVNKLNSNDIRTINMSNGIIKITYKNDNTMELDINTINDNIQLTNLADVDDEGIVDGQVLAFDSASNKYVPISISGSTVLLEAKAYTDEKVSTINKPSGKVVDSKPTYDSSTGEITYIISGVSDTTTDTDIWFYYQENSVWQQTLFIDGVEVTLDVNGELTLDEYVNKTTDIASSFSGEENDTSKVADIQALKDLLNIVNTKLGTKINTTDIIDDYYHEDTDKPVSARMVKELKTLIDNKIISIEGSGSIILKKTFENIVSGDTYVFEAPVDINNTCIIDVYKQEGNTLNLNGTLKAFDNTTKQDFIKNDEEVTIDSEGFRIKDEFEYTSTYNTDNGFYEIGLSDLICVGKIESEVVE